MHIEGIKALLRHKFFTLLEGRVATEEECKNLLVTLPENPKHLHGPTYTRKVRKHNKAKGALPPEEAAVCSHFHVYMADMNQSSFLCRQHGFGKLWRKGRPPSSSSRLEWPTKTLCALWRGRGKHARK
jgi:hypothetical protein